MSSKLNFNPEENMLSCAFNHACTLPKSKEVCNFPNYKECPEYQSRMIKLKASSKSIS